MSGTLEVYKDRRGEHRWRAVARNGEVVAVSGEGFTRRWNAKRAARHTFPGWRVKVIRAST